jgi:hypothetical protein
VAQGSLDEAVAGTKRELGMLRDIISDKRSLDAIL